MPPVEYWVLPTRHDLAVTVEGPPAKQSTTTMSAYRPTDRKELDDSREALEAIRKLRGIGKETFAALGGGEKWLRRERASFHKDAVAERPRGPERSR